MCLVNVDYMCFGELAIVEINFTYISVLTFPNFQFIMLDISVFVVDLFL